MIKFSTPWNREQYQVLGSTSSYTVFPGHNHSMHKVPPYCSCPAYAYSVLISKSQSMVRGLFVLFRFVYMNFVNSVSTYLPSVWPNDYRSASSDR